MSFIRIGPATIRRIKGPEKITRTYFKISKVVYSDHLKNNPKKGSRKISKITISLIPVNSDVKKRSTNNDHLFFR